MAEIKKIMIKGASGYCHIDESFEDKVSITPTSIEYEYVPHTETEINTKRKWSYRTDSPIFKKLYSDIVEMIPEIIVREVTDTCLDIGGIEFYITYSDN